MRTLLLLIIMKKMAQFSFLMLLSIEMHTPFINILVFYIQVIKYLVKRIRFSSSDSPKKPVFIDAERQIET